MYPYIYVWNQTIPSYGLCMVIALVLVSGAAMAGGRRRNIQPDFILLIAAVTTGAALAGAKLLYLFVTYPVSEIFYQLSKGRLDILIGGGLVFYGGAIAGTAGFAAGCRFAGIRMRDMEDIVVPYLPLGHAVGRIGCLLAGCCYGIEYKGIGAVYYSNHIFGLEADDGRFPVQPAEAAVNVLIFIWLLKKSKNPHRPYTLFLQYIMIYAAVRFFLEFLRGDLGRGIYFHVSASQWISLALFLTGVLGFVLQSRLSGKEKEIGSHH